jgi:hypothetical protein
MNLFKKTLLATAVMAVSGGAMAIQANNSLSKTVSADGLAAGLLANDGFESVLVHGDINLNLTTHDGANVIAPNYVVGDKVVLKLNGAIFTEDAVAPTISGTGKGTLAFGTGEISADRTEMTFEVTSANNTTANDVVFTYPESRIKLLSTAAEDEITVTAFAYHDLGSGFDLVEFDKVAEVAGSTSNTGIIAEVKKQFEIKTVDADGTNDNRLDATVDVAQERKGFENQSGPAQSVDFKVTLSDFAQGNSWIGAITPTTDHVVSIKGDFSAFDNEEKNGTIKQGSTELSVSEDKQQADFTTSTLAASGSTSTFTFAIGEEQVSIAPSAYTAEAVINYGSNKSIELSAVDAGQMELNGLLANIKYVPYGDNLEQFIWVTNESTLTGDVSVVATLEDGSSVDLGVVAESKPGLVKIDAAIAEALAAEGFTSGRAALAITINTPSTKTSVYGAYKVKTADDRLGLIVE